MEHLIITIRPANANAKLLRVSDAMQQILDVLRLHREARVAVSMTEEAFEWTLERASTNSPLTVTARAEPNIGTADVSEYVRAVNREFSTGIAQLTTRGTSPWWMDSDSLALAASIFKRNQNGITTTEIEASGADTVLINKQSAIAGLSTVSSIDVLNVEATAGEGEAWGEIRGVIDLAGRHYRQPAVRLVTADYGAVWCRLPPEIADSFGSETTLDETWKGKTLAVEGKFIYKAAGKLSRIIATAVRAVDDVPVVDLEAVRDLDFTSGLDPVEYLMRLHEGELA